MTNFILIFDMSVPLYMEFQKVISLIVMADQGISCTRKDLLQRQNCQTFIADFFSHTLAREDFFFYIGHSKKLQSLHILIGVQIDSIYTAGISNSWVLSNLSNWWIQLGKKIGVLLGDVCSSCNQLKLILKKGSRSPQI